MVQNISVAELVNVVKNAAVGTIGLIMLTDVRMKKAGNPLAGAIVKKMTTGQFMFGNNYGDTVAQHSGVDTFESNPLPWGQWLEGAENRIIENKGKFYLRYSNSVSKVTTVIMVNGSMANASELETVEAFSYDKKIAHTQKAVGLTEETKVVAQNVCFDNIVSITIGRTEYKVIH